MLGCLLRICAFAGLMLAPLFAIAAFLIFVLFDDDMSAHYATSAEARGDGVFGRGWLPRAVPDSSFDIDEWHNLDSNRGGGTFRFAASDAEPFRVRLHRATATDIQRVDSADLLSQGYSFYAFEKFVAAVNWQTREVTFRLGYGEGNLL